MADLTRFDFHALRFLKSDTIAEMTLAEVGQYILLLAEAWLSGKDASLPDNQEILARQARCTKVSDKVLDQFPVVQTQWGPRRQNETLYNEWRATNERLALAADNGRRGNESRWSGRVPVATPSGPDRVGIGRPSGGDRVPVAIPDQTRPTQTIPDQTSNGSGTFKFIAIRYSSWFGINHSHGKKHIEKYQNACSRFGEDRVLSAFDTWAAGAGWLKDKRDSNGLNFFWRPLEEIIEGDGLRQEREQVAQEAVQKVNNADAELAARMAEELRKEQEQEKIEEEKRKAQKAFEAANALEI